MSDKKANALKVYQVLFLLEQNERKRLMKFLSSPYFNQSKSLLRLCEIFIKNVENGNKSPDKQDIWNKMFPKAPYDDVNFRKYCSDLLKQVETFMAHENLYQDESHSTIETLNFVVKRKIHPLYNSIFRNARERSGKGGAHSLEYYYYMYSIERQYYSMMDFDVKLEVRPNIEEISMYLDVFYWVEKLKIHIAALSQKKTRNYIYDLVFVDEIIHFLQNHEVEKNPYLSLYYYSFLTISDEESKENYYKLRNLLDEHGAGVNRKEAKELYDLALHYCTGKLNKGEREFLHEYFNLFQAAISRGIFLVDGILAPWRFNNAVAAALQLGKLDWAEEFIKQNKGFLPADSRENTYTFNLARVYRYQQKYDKVLGLLRNVEYEDIGYNLISKAVLIITYYELDETEALDSFVESFRVFLNRHKNIPAARRKSYLNLIKYVRRLTRLLPGDTPGIEKLRQEIIREKASTVNHEWLLEKLTELE